MTKSKSVYDIAAPVAPWFGTAALVAIHFTLGPLFATPRTAATAFTMGISPFLPAKFQTLGMLIFSGIFFGLAYYLTIKKSGLMKWIGKYLNPLFLIFIAAVLLLALILPMGSFHQSASTAYQSNAGFQGILDGYNTMDGLALLGFSVSAIYAVKKMGFDDAATPKILAKAGLISIFWEALLYIALVLLGLTSLGKMSVAANGGAAFSKIITHYAGNLGILVTGIIVTLAVFTTAMGLFGSFAQDLNHVFPKISYIWWLRVIAGGSFITANAGLTNIIQWSTPVLMFLYPFALTLILLGISNKWVKQSPIMYRAVMASVTIPACLDALANSPLLKISAINNLINGYHQYLPLAADGFGWILPAIAGAFIGILILLFRQQRSTAKTPLAN